MPGPAVSNTICVSPGPRWSGAALALGLLGAGCSPAERLPDPAEGDLGKAASPLAWRDPQSLHPAGLGSNDRFGLSVALSEDTALVSAPRFPPSLPGGSVRVFGREGAGWTELAKLAPSDLGGQEKLGQSLVLEGDTALIGSPTGIGAFAPGAAYVFVRSGQKWALDAKLTTATGEANDYFAGSVALAGDTAFVGAPLHTVGANPEQGAVHVFRKVGSTWAEQALITAKDGQTGDRFGGPIAASGDTLAVVAPTNNGGGAVGKTYVFVRNGAAWTLQQEIGPPGGEAGTGFGHSVAISGDTLAIGAEHLSIAANDGGGVQVYERQSGVWSEPTALVGGDAAPADHLGIAVALWGDRLAAGASFADTPALDAGAVYVFDRSGGAWGEVAKLFVGGGATADYLGTAVAVQGDTVLAGAPAADKWGNSSGAAYVFEALLENGAACLGGAQCTSGHCIDSVCCNSLCIAANMACSFAAKGTGEDGVCGPIDTKGEQGGAAATGHGSPGSKGGAGGAGGAPAASDDTSYYSCAAAHGSPASGGLVLGVGLAMILIAPARRRRRTARRTKRAG